MPETPLHYQTITELSRQIQQRGLSPVALTEHFLARIAALNGTFGVFHLVMPERARAEAQAAEAALRSGRTVGPLHGIPYALKDLFDVQGAPTTAGSNLLSDNIAAEDAAVVTRLAQAGMILLGKTVTVQFAFGGVGINHHHGTPHNPWHATPHVPGGSSSGSAVAVAAGLAPVALGTDTGGSVRIPAALCGLTGLKTTVGEVSRAGVFPLSASLDSVGPLARDRQGRRAGLSGHPRPRPRDPSTVLLEQDVLTGLRDGVRGLRLAFAESGFWDGADPEVAAAVRACGRSSQTWAHTSRASNLPKLRRRRGSTRSESSAARSATRCIGSASSPTSPTTTRSSGRASWRLNRSARPTTSRPNGR